jgi:hypothetical protein
VVAVVADRVDIALVRAIMDGDATGIDECEQVLELLAANLTNTDIAARPHVSRRTADPRQR